MVNNSRVGGYTIGPNQPCFIIAEAGVNHNGDVELAKRLVDVAAEAGADAVKFQTFCADRLVSITAPKAEYQLQTTDTAESQLDMLRRLELSPTTHRELDTYCEECGVLFLSTPFDEGGVDLLDELGVPAFKIGSGEVTNWPFLEYVARKGKPIILSTGMSYLSEVDEAVRVIRGAGCNQLTLLHCISNYPAAPADANLRAMQTMAAAFDVSVGYSDHTPGVEIALAAVALGACVIEKHLTLDRNLPGPDHRASLEPRELRALVAGVRAVEQALGSGVKRPVPAEMGNREVGRRSLVATQAIAAGTVITREMLIAKRPATGVQPIHIDLVVGRTAMASIPAGQVITFDLLS